MTHTKVEAIYAIRHKATGEFVRANGKGCWLSKAAAQSSFNRCYWGGVRNKFKDQQEYEIVDLLDVVQGLQDALECSTAQEKRSWGLFQECLTEARELREHSSGMSGAY